LLRWLYALGFRIGTGTKGLIASLGLVLALGFAAGLIALVGFVALASEVMEHETQQVDLAALIWIRQSQSPALDVVARATSALGSEVLIGVWILLLIGLAFQRQMSAAAGLATVTIGASLLNSILKGIIQRARPEPLAGIIPAQAFSFPSGHAMTAAAFYGYLAILAWRRWHGWRRNVAVAGLAGLVLAISLSRVYLGVHYITDVIAGCIAGLLWADAVALSAALLRRRLDWGLHTPAAAEPLAEVAGAQHHSA
jgi:membrane-associated phospholipid phosphatase